MASQNSTISTNMGLKNLLTEPKRLTSESEKVNTELEALVMENYKVFVENLTCSVHLQSEDKILGEISSELNNNISDFSNQCHSFKDRVAHFVQNHKRNRKTLQHHMQLVELLEVPQLVDACARNGFHDEALELAHFVNGLERRHLLAVEVKSSDGKTRAGSGVVQNIVDEVHKTLSSLRQQLLIQLTETVTLPQEMQILSTLRKLDGLLIDRCIAQKRFDGDAKLESSVSSSSSSSNNNLEVYQQLDKQREEVRRKYAYNSEVRLQMDFLEARSVWLERSAAAANTASNTAAWRAAADEAISSSSSSSSSSEGKSPSSSSSSSSSMSLGPYGKTIEMLELRRASWFSVITHFKALFLDNNSLLFQDDSNNSARSSPSKSSIPSSSNGGATESSSQQYNNEVLSQSTATVINTWASLQVRRLLNDMKVLLPQIDEGGSLRSVLEQMLFFSARMSQVGCDFSSSALELVKEIIIARFDKDLQSAWNHFKIMVESERIVFSDSVDGIGGGREQIVPLYNAQDPAGVASADSSSSSSVRSATKSEEISAPSSLMKYPPMAYLLNCILTSLNFIRECPLVTVKEAVSMLLLLLYRDIAQFIADNAATIRSRGDKYLNDRFSRESSMHGGANKKGGATATPVAGGADVITSPMDILYAEALLMELMPHTILCLDSCFAASNDKTSNSGTNSSEVLRTKIAKLRTGTVKSGSAPASSSAGRYLVNSLAQSMDALGCGEWSQQRVAVIESCWTSLQKEGLIKAPVTPTPTPVSARATAATAATNTGVAPRSAATAASPSAATTAPAVAAQTSVDTPAPIPAAAAAAASATTTTAAVRSTTTGTVYAAPRPPPKDIAGKRD